jgi:penicillin-binding protein 2
VAERVQYSGNSEFGSSLRQKVFIGIVVLIGAVFILRLAYVQIIRGGEYKNESLVQAIKEDVVEPFRGNMYDRNGLLLVHNEPSFTVTLTINDFHRDRLPLVASILKTDTNSIIEILRKNRFYSIFQGIKIARDVEFDIVSQIEEYGDLLPGIEVIKESKRLYNFDCNMSHMLGYTREVTQNQLNQMRYMNLGDLIGQSGIEQSYDNFLRGQKGINYVAIARNGEKISRYNSGLNDEPVNNGFDLHLTIDKKLQELAEDLLKNRAGAAVAIDPRNGEVLCLASKPDFDPRKFSGKVPEDIYNQLRDDPGKPLYNRALQSIYPPGSTWKMLVAIACLNEGIINEHSTIFCPGSFAFGNKSYACHGAHGQVDVRKAIQASCNVFFYNLGLKLGLEKMAFYGQLFGFGERTHIDIPNEGKGVMPTVEWLTKRFKEKKWIPRGLLVNYGIGQGEISVTPLQMAVYAACLANSGTINQPHVVKTIDNNVIDKDQPVDYSSKQIKIDPRIFKMVREGMFAVVNIPGGTANNAQVPGIKVAGKTGTAQNPHGQDHSWFICFAPYDDPKIAIAVIVENAGFGSTVAAPIARDMVAQYLGVSMPKPQPVDSTKLTPTR